MKNRRLTVLPFIIGFLICSIEAYSVQGKWQLEYDENFKSIIPNSLIVFDFKKDIVEGKIVENLLIYACSVISYRYEINDDDIFLDFKEIGANRRICEAGQISQLRLLLDNVVYTITIADNLILLSPSGKIVMKLKKIKERKLLTSLSGIWNIIQVQKQRSSIFARANETQLQICSGKGIIEHKIPRQNRVQFKILKGNDCRQNSLLLAIYQSLYARRFVGNQIYFYNGNYDITMKWQLLQYINPQQLIQFSPPVKLQVSNQEDKNEDQKQEIDQAQFQKKTQQSLNQDNQKISGSQIEQQTSQIKQKDSTKSQQVLKIISSQQTSQKIQLKQEQTNQNNQQPTTLSTNQANQASEIPKKQIEVENKILIPLTFADIRTKWFPVKKTAQSLMYSLIILSNRILISTECSTIYSSLSVANGQNGQLSLLNILPASTNALKCELIDGPILNMLNSIDYVTVEITETSKKMTAWDKQRNAIQQFVLTMQ